jgi:hypothetical protein
VYKLSRKFKSEVSGVMDATRILTLQAVVKAEHIIKVYKVATMFSFRHGALLHKCVSIPQLSAR